MTDFLPSKVELELLRNAFKSSQGVSVGSITSKLGISIKDASIAFRSLRKVGFVREQGGALFITRKGRVWTMAHQNLFAFTGEATWRKVPEEFWADRMQPFEPYAPRISKLSKAHFGLGGKRRGW